MNHNKKYNTKNNLENNNKGSITAAILGKRIEKIHPKQITTETMTKQPEQQQK